ncbi:DsbA family protein [Flavihumibacter sp. RY-1]|uniref:DsbA family protein n=1 Tax=Flavihumibacter fluminis TaxID=2909236 RepID=A0ABS9BIV0_9BACT|nr:DsbA family protein [Flavihumibacter fluminis]MCF1715487.1 DsbA family protein [Flavihumibacter fluminis]
MTPVLYYCYDAYCGWCYGFSPVIKKIHELYSDRVGFEVLSGGMILPDQPRHIGVMAGYIADAYKSVEELTGIRFGQDYLWHIFNPDLSDWYPNSEKPAIALCIFKELYPDQQVEFASDLQYALHFEGRDLCDNEAYRHLLEKYNIDADDFYQKLGSEEYKEKAYYEFQLCKQLQVTGYPCVLMQVSESKFFMLARGYTDEASFIQRIEAVLADLNKN